MRSRTATEIVYLGWFLVVLALGVAMLADTGSVAGVIGSIGVMLVLWALPFVLWPDVFR